MSEVIVVTSGKGGVGKTTTSANVGTGLIDTDIGLRNLDVVMGLENRIVYNLVDVVEGNCRIKQAIIRDKRYPTLFLLPSAQTRDKSAVNPSQMVRMISHLKDQFDHSGLPGRDRAGVPERHSGSGQSACDHDAGSVRHPRRRPHYRAFRGQ